MTHLLKLAPALPQQAPTALTALHEAIDETIAALSTFDAERLETIQTQVGALTVEFLARSLGEDREGLSELLRKHTELGEILNATAANLRVVASVIESKRAAAGLSTRNAPHDRSNLVSWPR